jgi:FAD binding domain
VLAPVHRGALEALAAFAGDPQQAARLRFLVGAKVLTVELLSYAHRPRLSNSVCSTGAVCVLDSRLLPTCQVFKSAHTAAVTRSCCHQVLTDVLYAQASPDGKADFQAWAVAPGRTLLEAMQEFPSAKPPLGMWALCRDPPAQQHCPSPALSTVGAMGAEASGAEGCRKQGGRLAAGCCVGSPTTMIAQGCSHPAGAFFGAVAKPLQPRFYSISSSPKAHPRHVHVTCSVIREPKGTGRVHNGVASTWLGRLPIGEELTYI